MSSPSSADQPDLPPPASLAIHLDLLGGLAGDMFVAAMVDALPALAPLVLAELAAVQPAGTPVPGFFEASTGGLRAQRFGIAPAPDAVAYRFSPAKRAGAIAASARAEDHAGTAYSVLRRKLVDAPMSAATREQALALLALLADAEAHVHGTSVDNVHFHELADWDSLMDLVAAGCIAATLAGARWTASAPPLGGGNVRTAHGLLPVPVPATALLLTGYPWRDDGIPGERVTPTGAAILRHLVPASDCDARHDAGRLLSVGSGAGTRALPGLPNITRALVLERAVAIEARRCRRRVGARIRRRRHDRRGNRDRGRSLAHAAWRHRCIDRYAPRQEGKAARGFSGAGTAARYRGDRAGLLHRNLDTRPALA